MLAAALCGAAGTAFLWIYNRLIQLRNQQREAWSGIDVQLRRRHDLIPALVECVKGYQKHEAGLFTDIAAARSAAVTAPAGPASAGAETRLSGQVRHLFAIAEAYPELKAGENFRALSAQLVAIEDELQYARRYYNGSVRDFRNAAESFPANLVAGLFRFQPDPFFEIETATERSTPGVQL